MDDRASIELALIIDRLKLRGKLLGAESILPLAELKLPDPNRRYPELIGDWLAQGWIEGDAQRFQLTTAGAAFVQAIPRRYSLHALFYNVLSAD